MSQRHWVDSFRIQRNGAFKRMVFGLVLLGGISGSASAADYCYDEGDGCVYDTLEDAEAAMRADAKWLGDGDLAVHVGTEPYLNDRLKLRYVVPDRSADAIYGPMYFADMGIKGDGRFGCMPDGADPRPGYSDWCGSEANLIAQAQAHLLAGWPGCTLTGTSVINEYSSPNLQGVSSSRYGKVEYNFRSMRTTANCPTTTETWNWTLHKETTVECRSGFRAITMPVVEGTFETENLCSFVETPFRENEAFLTAPIRQCASCPASPNPVYPATGDKARQEVDFSFAGRPFVRNYHSLRQFGKTGVVGVGWTHSFTDRVLIASGRLEIVDDAGNIERFRLVSSDLYRGENSTDKVLEAFASGTVRWRLRLPDGEVREFNADRRLIHVIDPDDPRLNLVLAYASGILRSITDGQGRTLTFSYLDSQLAQIAMPDGDTVEYTYDARANLVQVDYPGGAYRQYHYNEATLRGAANQYHHLTGITTENGQRFASFKYDALGRVIESRVLGSPNEVTEVSYDSATQATVRTMLGQDKIYTMQGNMYRRITKVDLGGGVDSENTYDTYGRLTASLDRRGVQKTYAYHSVDDSDLASITHADGEPEERREEFTRNAAFLLTERRTYDAANTLVAKIVLTYNAQNQIATRTAVDPGNSANNRTTTVAYCDATDAAVPNSTCPIVGLVKSIDGPRSVDDGITYDYRSADATGCAATPATCAYRKGDLWKTTTGTDLVGEILAYDGAGRILSMNDANGVVTDLVYHPRGWLIATKVRGTNNASETDDRITVMDYTPDGLIETIALPDGSLLEFGYDFGRRLTTVEDGLGNRIVYTLDAAGNRIKEETSDSSVTLRRTLARAYGTLGRLTQIRDHHGQQPGNPATLANTYDTGGNLTGTTDALGRDTTAVYDPLGRLRSSIADDGGADEATTGFTYDALDRLETVVDPNGLETTYTYNAFGERTGLESPDTGISSATYDKAGNLATSLDANGNAVSYAYDEDNHLTAVDYAGTDLDETYTYDTAEADCQTGETFLKGRLAKVEDGSGSTTWCYNRFGDLVRKVQRSNGMTFVLRWSYETSGRLASMVYPDGTFLYYSYDLQGRVSSIDRSPDGNSDEMVLSGAQYAPFGPAQSWTFGNGLQHRRSVNLDYRPGFIEDGPEGTPGPGLNLGYGFDAVGNLTRLNAADQFTVKRRYTHDGQDRLTKVEDALLVDLHAYAYDDTGNRTSFSDGTSQSYTYATGTHHLASVAGVSRAHDDAGNLETVGSPATRSYTYNAANRMATATIGGTTASYRYNAMGERVRKTVSSTDRYSFHDEAGRWIGDYDHSGNAIQQIIWFGDLPVTVLTGSGSGQKGYYIEPDALGTPRVVIDPSRDPLSVGGTVVWRWDLEGEAFGAGVPNQDPDGDSTNFVFDMRFPGQRYDAHTGLNYNYFRDYDPGTGRYAQSDPIGISGGISTYGYVGANPLTRIDPTGLRPPNDAEREFIRQLFGDCFNPNRIDIEKKWSWSGSRPWSPHSGSVNFPGNAFINGDESQGLNLTNRYVGGSFAHEIFHVWQRDQSGTVTTFGAVLQTAYSASGAIESATGMSLSNPYQYMNIPNPHDNLQYFKTMLDHRLYEAQAAMWEDLFLNSGRSPFDAARWKMVKDYVQDASGCRCSQ